MFADVFEGPGFIVGLALGVVLGWVTLWSFQKPLVGRIIARICAVVALAFGVGWLVVPVADLLDGNDKSHYESPLGNGDFASALGWAATGLTAGILILVLSFLRTGTKSAVRPEENAPFVVPAEPPPPGK